MYDKVTEGVYSRGEVAVFDGSQINVTLMRRIGDGQLFHRKLLQHGNIRHQCDTVIDGYQTDNGTVLFHLADDVGLYAHLSVLPSIPTAARGWRVEDWAMSSLTDSICPSFIRSPYPPITSCMSFR